MKQMIKDNYLEATVRQFSNSYKMATTDAEREKTDSYCRGFISLNLQMNQDLSTKESLDFFDILWDLYLKERGR